MRIPETLLVFLLLLTVELPTAAQGVDVCPASSSSIVINEIMYDPPGSPDVEYIEIYNAGDTPVDLTDWFLLDNLDTHDKCFLVGTLNPGEYLVVAGFVSLFSAKYPGVTNINANEFDDVVIDQGFVLGDGGDTVRLFDAPGILMDCVVYDDTPPWPTEPDGDGPSLELYHPSLDNTLATSWAASTNPPPEGTPGVQNSVFTTDQPPIVSDSARDIPLPSNSDTVTVTATVTDLVGLSMVELMVDTGSGFVSQLMFDDGLNGDIAAGDDLFSTQIAPHSSGTLVRYYVQATDTAALTTTLPGTAPIEYFAYTVDHQLPLLVINEILASNLTGIVDESGTPEDWLEIRNAGAVPVNLEEMYLSNSLQQSMEWKLPDVTIEPGAYLVVWADDDDIEGPLHTNFKLSASGSAIAIWETVDHGNVMIQGYKFGVQSTDVSFGYWPEADGDAPEYLTTPTPGASNDTSTLFSAIAINEFQTTSAMGGIDDWVELYNRGTTTVVMNGWHLTDEVDQPTKFTFPSVPIVPGAFVVLNETLLGFAFSSTGSEVIMLSDATGAGKDFFDYGPQEPDISQGRFANGTANWFFFANPTRGFSNNCDVVPPAEACDDGNPCTDDVCSGGSVCVNTPNDANSCDDGDVCNGAETCSAGVCNSGTPLTCEDSNLCTIDSCDPAGGCEYEPVVCDDGDACNGVETCDPASGCEPGTPPDCDDADACTDDTCESATGCVHTAISCDDGDACNGVETCDPASGCEPGTTPDCDDADACTDDTCEPATGCVHTAISCDDGDACTIDSCDPAGGCLYEPVVCDDGDACNGVETCNPASGCEPGTPPDCDDADACTDDTCESATGCVQTAISCDDSNACTIDSCDPAGGCQYEPVVCDDGDACNGVETCDPASGCEPGTPPDCDDADACTDDTCESATGCVNTAISCDDSNACTIDSCDPAGGCEYEPVVCDDGDACNGVETCDPASGCEPGTPPDCDDADACTDDTCESATGCVHTAISCDDGNACTIDSCDPAGGCEYDPVVCDDGDACNGVETCNPASGCEPGTPPDCDDADACTDDTCESATGCVNTAISCDDGNACTIDSCDPAGGCEYDPVVCDDGNACNGVETCDPASGCEPGTPPDCDDADACTDDTCESATGCVNTAISCDDGNACTIDSCDPAGGCEYDPVVCDDGDACNGVETCDPASGCEPGTPPDCDDADACTDDTCESATGCVNTAISCDDGNACTIDSCDPAGGCEYDPVVCDDGNACNGVETCDPASGCEPGTPPDCDDADACTDDTCESATGCVNTAISCDDGNACTIDSCDPAGGCEYEPVVCDDGIYCNGIEVCQAGDCVAGPPPNCNDGDDCTVDSCDVDLDACTNIAPPVPDEVLGLLVSKMSPGSATAVLTWAGDPVATSYNVYRSHLGDLGDLACFLSAVSGVSTEDDGAVPEAGGIFYHLTTAVNCSGECPLGAGRSNTDPCQ